MPTKRTKASFLDTLHLLLVFSFHNHMLLFISSTIPVITPSHLHHFPAAAAAADGGGSTPSIRRTVRKKKCTEIWSEATGRFSSSPW